MQTKYANKLKNEPQDERLPRKFPQGTRQVRDYDTFLILLTFTSNTFFLMTRVLLKFSEFFYWER